MQKVAAYIDGALFLHGTRGLGMSMDLDLAGLIKTLVPLDDVVKIYYYAPLSPESIYPDRRINDEKTLARFAGQGIETRACRIEVKAHVSIERGIESGISTQMVFDAAANLYDTALVVSKRPELADPIAAVRKMGKQVSVVFYEYELDSQNILKASSDNYAALRPEMVLEFRKGGPKPPFSY